MIKMKFVTSHTLLFVALAGLVSAEIGIPRPEAHIAEASHIVEGRFEQDAEKRIYFLVRSSLKGNLVPGVKILIDNESRLAWKFRLGGEPAEVSLEQFRKLITTKKWFKKRVILLGHFKEGRWTSCFLDWSVWPDGEKEFQDKSFSDVAEYILGKTRK